MAEYTTKYTTCQSRKGFKTLASNGSQRSKEKLQKIKKLINNFYRK